MRGYCNRMDPYTRHGPNRELGLACCPQGSDQCMGKATVFNYFQVEKP